MLLNFEWNRIFKLYVSLILLVFVIQTIGVVFISKQYLKYVELDLKAGISQAEIMEMYGRFSLGEIIGTMPFLVPIALSVAAIAFYIFFIWYRDWLGKNTFVYRLLMLPTSRMNVFFAKLMTIMTSVLGLVAIQFMFLYIYRTIIKWIIPQVYRQDLDVVRAAGTSEYLSIILPKSMEEFFIAYGLGMLVVILIFTAILMERSFRFLGIVYGGFFIGIAVLLFILPTLIQVFFFGTVYLYPGEFFIVQFMLWLIILVISLLASRYLLKNKVTV